MGRVGVVGVGWDGTVGLGIVWTGWHSGHGGGMENREVGW